MQPQLSIILIVHNMQRAAPRAIASLCAAYQSGIDSSRYEILVVENGSKDRLSATEIEEMAPNIRYFYLDSPPPSPAFAINFAAEKARGDTLCLMVDGAHMLTPGVLRHALEIFRAKSNPLVLAPAFFLGPGPQTETIYQGYNEEGEDKLLAGISWPENGYRLFEVGVPYRIEFEGVRPKLFWFVKQFESNCLFMRRDSFHAVNGCDERFDIPGGGMLIPDLYRRLCDQADAEIVQLVGEASFHQVHGGISTNVDPQSQAGQWERYSSQYEAIRGNEFVVSPKPVSYYGHMPNQHARKLMLTG
jgi:glycosyltransferase involved in cell wall biosynthesis